MLVVHLARQGAEDLAAILYTDADAVHTASSVVTAPALINGGELMPGADAGRSFQVVAASALAMPPLGAGAAREQQSRPKAPVGRSSGADRLGCPRDCAQRGGAGPERSRCATDRVAA
jgi:hypothetical protein